MTERERLANEIVRDAPKVLDICERHIQALNREIHQTYLLIGLVVAWITIMYWLS